MALHSGERVLVHSVKGISRSATLCLAYLTKYKFESLKEAFLFLASKRPLVRPNIGFWSQLIAFEQVGALCSLTFIDVGLYLF